MCRCMWQTNLSSRIVDVRVPTNSWDAIGAATTAISAIAMAMGAESLSEELIRSGALVL